MKVGRIIHVDKEKGWGFISSKDVPFTRIFFHWTGLSNDTIHFTEVEKGMDVEFNTKEIEGRVRAINIHVLEAEDGKSVGSTTEGSNPKLD
jgi:cold shock CspA family protein